MAETKTVMARATGGGALRVQKVRERVAVDGFGGPEVHEGVRKILKSVKKLRGEVLSETYSGVFLLLTSKSRNLLLPRYLRFYDIVMVVANVCTYRRKGRVVVWMPIFYAKEKRFKSRLKILSSSRKL